MKKLNTSTPVTFYKLARISEQVPEYAAINPKTLLKCACKHCPVQCQCLCHILPQLAHDRKYSSKLKEHALLFLVGAFWSFVAVFFWATLGTGDLILAGCLVAFFWLCHLLRFFYDTRWFPNLEALDQLKISSTRNKR